MKRLVAMVCFAPALVGWLIFAPSWKLANRLFPRSGYSHWFWLNVEAIEHDTYYSVYDDENTVP